MTDNKSLIEPLLTFPNEDNFYYLQILQRKKDHKGQALGGSTNNSRLIKSYYITSVEKLNIHWEEIVTLCNVFEARASINLNPRSFEKAAFKLIQKVANQMMNKDFYNVRRAYDSICGEYHAEIDKRLIIDIYHYDDIHNMNEIMEYITKKHEEQQKREYKVLATIPSKSGFHIITNPFNIEHWSEKFPRIEIHKNNPTNLYIP